MPPTAIATTAAVIGPREPAVSAPSRCRPSAAAPAIPRYAQLTAATAESSTPPHGTGRASACGGWEVYVVMTAPEFSRLSRLRCMVPRSVMIRTVHGRLPLSGGVSAPSTATGKTALPALRGRHH